MSPDTSALSRAADLFENPRDRWQFDPTGWVRNRVPDGFLWSKQQQIGRSVVENKRTAVPSCHSAGKTRLAAALALWWIDSHPPGSALVVTTAPSHSQLHGVLWAEMRTLHAAARLEGKILGDDRWVLPDGTELAVGRRPPDHNGMAAFQGYHRKFVLVIMDEACGLPEWMWTAVETITTSAECRILAIGNPDDNTSIFAKVCQPGSGWETIKISAFDSPNYTGEQVPADIAELLVGPAFVEEKRRMWGEESPLWRSKIEGEFADAEAGLIPFSWIQAANRRWHEFQQNGDPEHRAPTGRIVFGVDPAGRGRDRTAIARRQGQVVLDVTEYRGLDTTQVTGVVQAKLRGAPQSSAVVDVIGLGTGVVDQLRRAGAPVYAFNASHSAPHHRDATKEWRFPNKRSASWWHLRELLDPNLGHRLALPPNDDLAAELCAPRFEYRAGGLIVVEKKDDTKKRIGRSPDLADAVVYSCWRELGDASRDFKDNRGRGRTRPWVDSARFTNPGGGNPWGPDNSPRARQVPNGPKYIT